MVTKVIQVRLASNKEDLNWLLKDAKQKKKDIKQAMITGGMSQTQWDKETGQPLQVMIAMMSGIFSEDIDLACLKDIIQNEVVLFWMGHNYCLPVSNEDVLGYAKKIIDKATKEYKAMIDNGGEWAIITFDPEGDLIECRSDRGSQMSWSTGTYDKMTQAEKTQLMLGDNLSADLKIYHKYGIQHGKHKSIEAIEKDEQAKKKEKEDSFNRWKEQGYPIQFADGTIARATGTTDLSSQAWPTGTVTREIKTDSVSSYNITWNLTKKDI
jgi:hypothetical protein